MTNDSPNTIQISNKFTHKGRNIMANNTVIFNNVELYFSKLDPANPNSRFDKENPTWEVQIRTKDKAVAKEWKSQNLRVTPDENDDGVFYRANLKKKSKKRDGSDMAPVNVVAGDLSPVDPATIGNGSVANLSVFQYDYNMNGKDGVASMLMGVQITTLNEYKPRPNQGGFAPTEFTVNKVADNQEVDADMVAGDTPDDDLDF
jgi:hypothetical protein